MEFWGVEVKAGEPLRVELDDGRALHLSQACLGEIKKDKGHESVCLYVNVDGKKLVLGTLFSEKLPQQMFDLVFDKEFELSHNWKNGSVFFYGYTADNHDNASGDDDIDSDSESEEDIPLLVPNGAPATQVKQEKPAEVQNSKAGKESAAAGKQKVKHVEADKSEDEEDSSDEDDSMSDDDDSEDAEDNKSASDEDDDIDEEEPPAQPVEKVKSGKKRASVSAPKTPVPDKKAKLVTPQKTDGKKSSVVHVATPHPSKQTGKTPANKPNQQTPKTEGSHSCKSCNRTFKSEMALDSHNKAKHSG